MNSAETKLNTQSLSGRLAWAFALVVGIFVAVLLTEAYNAKQVEQATQRMTREAELLKLADQWLADVRQNSARSLAVAQSSGGDMLAFFKDDMAATSRSTTQTQKAFLELAVSEQSKARASEVGQVRKEWLAARDEINRLKAAGQDDEARLQVKTRFVQVTQRYIQVTQDLADGQMAQVRDLQTEISERFQRLFWTGGILVSMGVVVAVVLCALFVRRLRMAIQPALQAAQRLGEGDLTEDIRVQGRDELAQLQLALNSAQAQLRQLIGGVRASTDSIRHASHEIATGNLDLSSRTEQAASSLEQTASSMEEMAAAIRHSADNSRLAHELADRAVKAAQAGGEVVRQFVVTMDGISESSRRIADIIGTIDGIAFQTNILALNAAVEAARAGEQGRGFAVVAGEVRTLAGRSAEAAREIKSLIGTSVDRVEQGSTLVAEAGQSMDEIAQGVQRVRQVIGDMATASAQQADGVNQINAAVSHLDQMTQQNAALVEQSAAATASLSEQSEQLAGAVQAFKV